MDLRECPSYPGVWVSEDGTAVQQRSAVVVVNWEGAKYPYVCLDGRQIALHLLVADAWVSPRKNNPGLMVCHRDDIKANCNARNLYYGTSANNAADYQKNKLTPQYQEEARKWRAPAEISCADEEERAIEKRLKRDLMRGYRRLWVQQRELEGQQRELERDRWEMARKKHLARSGEEIRILLLDIDHPGVLSISEVERLLMADGIVCCELVRRGELSATTFLTHPVYQDCLCTTDSVADYIRRELQ